MGSPGSVRTLAFGGMVGMAVAMGIGRFVYTPLLPPMMEGLGLSAADAGLIASANFVGYLIGAVLASGGWGAGRERPIALAGLLATAALAAVMGLEESVPAFLAIRFAAGVASAFVLIFLSTILYSQYAAAGRRDLGAFHFGGVGLGIAVSSVMTGILQAQDMSWQSGWFWSGALSLAGVAIVWGTVDRGTSGDAAVTVEPPMRVSPMLTRVILAYGLFGFGYVITATFLVAIVRSGQGGPLSESLVWMVTGIAALTTTGVWIRVSNRLGLSRTFALACIIEAAGVIASVAMPGLAGPLLGGFLLGGTFVAITAFGLQAGRALAAMSPRRVMAMMTAAFGIGQILGPLVAGYLADWSGSFVLASLTAAATLIAAAFAMPSRAVPV